jgi:ABC-type oligopeptide transport system substrate-binding subunit
VTSGPFQFGEYIGAGEQVTLLPNQDYPDPTNPAGVIPTGYIMKLIGDANIQLEQFLAGEITYLERVVNQARLPELREMGKQGTIQTYEFSPGRSYNYLALNYADPDNPQNGVDESGNLIDQGHHPLFGDVRVRHAIWMAIDRRHHFGRAGGG